MCNANYIDYSMGGKMTYRLDYYPAHRLGYTIVYILHYILFYRQTIVLPID